ncbi:MAG: polysaccharide biosynthesis tyrosine autokinase, partial [Flavobacteriales bacterium]|nr:polysaccharide biosynthesis tyrosine autokinase [Flavobacteriales bacterium]
ISYFERKNYLTQERYDYKPFVVKLDTASLQVVGVPIYVQIDRDQGTYRVTAEGKNVELYNVQQELISDLFIEEVAIDQVARIGEPFVGDHLSFTIEFPEDRKYSSDSEYFFYINSLSGNVGYYRGKLSVAPISEASNIVKLSSPGEVVSKERAFLSKLMETYLEVELYKQQQKGLKTINFIDAQIGNVSDSLKQVESSMESFRGQSGGMMSAGTTSDALFLERSRLEDERSAVMQKRQYCLTILEKLRASDDFRNVAAPSSSGIDDAVLNSLVIQLTDLYADLAAQNLSTVRSNPTIIAMERKIKNIKASLVETAEGLVSQADISLNELNRRLGSINYQFNQLPENERRLVNIERQFKLSDNLYNYLMEKRAEAGIAINSDQIDKFIVDEPRLDSGEPLAPNKKMVLGGAVFMALLLPALLIILLDFFDDRVKSLEEVKRMTAIPLLATIPGAKKKRVLPSEPKSILAEAFRTVRINLEYLGHGRERKVIGLTSSSSGEGKTFCALNLATVLAISGKRTIVVDADMRRPRLADSLGFEEGPGLSSYLIGGCTIDELVRSTDIEGLDAINAGPIPPNPLELVELPAMSELMARLKERYDRIVIDAAPMGLVSEFLILMRHTDVNLFVVREGYTQRRSLRLISEMFEEKKIDQVELLLNDVKNGQTYGSGYYTN